MRQIVHYYVQRIGERSRSAFPLKRTHIFCYCSSDIEGRAIDNYRIVARERVERESVWSKQSSKEAARSKGAAGSNGESRARQMLRAHFVSAVPPAAVLLILRLFYTSHDLSSSTLSVPPSGATVKQNLSFFPPLHLAILTCLRSLHASYRNARQGGNQQTRFGHATHTLPPNSRN